MIRVKHQIRSFMDDRVAYIEKTFDEHTTLHIELSVEMVEFEVYDLFVLGYNPESEYPTRYF